jgi:hypothetical protein
MLNCLYWPAAGAGNLLLRVLRVVAFHTVNALLSKNHAAVPLCRAFSIKLWFIDGSGGESQC